MPAGVETDCCLEMHLFDEVICGYSSRLRYDSVVEVSYIGLVMFGMVKRHNLFGNIGFERLRAG